jgi:hypothetical protein
MQTLADRFERSYDDFDLSDNIFVEENFERCDWRHHVPLDIMRSWKVLQVDERFLVALVAELQTFD